MVENGDRSVDGAVDNGAVDPEGVGSGVWGLDGGGTLAGLCTMLVIGSKIRTCLP